MALPVNVPNGSPLTLKVARPDHGARVLIPECLLEILRDSGPAGQPLDTIHEVIVRAWIDN